MLFVQIYGAVQRTVQEALRQGADLGDLMGLVDKVLASLPASATWLQVVVVACWAAGLLDALLAPGPSR